MGCKNSSAATTEDPVKLENKDMEKPKKDGYDRNAEKDQEIGEEFLNPDKDMDEAASKIQKQWKAKQAKKLAKGKPAENGKGESEVK